MSAPYGPTGPQHHGKPAPYGPLIEEDRWATMMHSAVPDGVDPEDVAEMNIMRSTDERWTFKLVNGQWKAVPRG